MDFNNVIFVFIISVFLIITMVFAFKNFTKENYQFLAVVPVKKKGKLWHGINYTLYGAIIGFSAVFAIFIFYFLMVLGRYNFIMTAAVILPLSVIAAVSSSFLARLIEKKKYVFSVGAAIFVSIAVAPYIMMIVNKTLGVYLKSRIDFIYIMSAACTAFLFGEGIGRMACISFGCCYGKNIDELPKFWKLLFSKINFVFYGKTKKIAYASCMDGKKVVPVQAITSIVLNFAGVVSLSMILAGKVYLAFLFSSIFIFLWRFVSEFLRADYRGGRKISVYQMLSIVSIIYVVIMAIIGRKYLITDFSFLKIPEALKILWDPSVIIVMEIVWIICVNIFGRSKVTASNIDIFVLEDNI